MALYEIQVDGQSYEVDAENENQLADIAASISSDLNKTQQDSNNSAESIDSNTTLPQEAKSATTEEGNIPTEDTAKPVDSDAALYDFSKYYSDEQAISDIENHTQKSLKILQDKANKATSEEEKLAIMEKVMLIKKSAKDSLAQFEKKPDSLLGTVGSQAYSMLSELGLTTAQATNFITRNINDLSSVVSDYVSSKFLSESEKEQQKLDEEVYGKKQEQKYQGILASEEKELKKITEMRAAEGKGTVGSFLGENIYDFVGGFLSKPAKVVLAEAGLSTIRHNDIASEDVPVLKKIASISTDTGLALMGATILNKLLPNTQKAELADAVLKIKDPVERKSMQETVDILDRLKIETLDDNARLKIVNEIKNGSLKTQEEVSTMIREEVAKAKEVAYKAKEEAYNESKSEAMQSNKFNYMDKNALDRFSNFAKDRDIGWNVSDDTRKILSKFRKDLQSKTNGDAWDLEQLRQYYNGKKGDTTDDNIARLYGKIVDYIDNETNTLLGNKKGIFDNARDLHEEYINSFKSGATGFDASNAKVFSDMLKNQKYVGEAERIFTEKMDKNAVISFKKKVTNDPKKLYDMTYSMLMNNVDNPASREGVEQIISNYGRMKQDGLIEMLGREGHNKLKAKMRGAEIIKVAMDEAEKKMPSKIAQDILSIGTAALEYKFMPFVAGRQAIQAAGRIVEKTTRGDRNAIINKLSKYKQTAQGRKILQGFMLMGIND